MLIRKNQDVENNELTKPQIVKGNHLTVTTYPDGYTELEWDWDALVEEVRVACENANQRPAEPEPEVAKKIPSAFTARLAKQKKIKA